LFAFIGVCGFGPQLKLVSSSGIQIKHFSFEDLFNFLRGKGTLNPQSVESRAFLFKNISEKFNEHQWASEYEDQISALIRSYAVDLNQKRSQYNRIIRIHLFFKKNLFY